MPSRPSSRTQAQYELLKAIAATGSDAEQSYDKAGKATQGYGSIVKKTTGLLGDLKKQEKDLEDKMDFTKTELAAATLGEAFKDLKANMQKSVDAMIFGGETLKQALAESFRNTLAQTASFLGKKAMLKGLEEEAEALTSLAALDFAGFARHQAAAAGWFALAAAAAIGGQMITGSRKSASASAGGGSSSSASQSQPTPNNQSFVYNAGPLSSSQAAQPGSHLTGVGAMDARLAQMAAMMKQQTQMIVAAMERNTKALGTFETADFNDLLVKSSTETNVQRAIGRASHNHLLDSPAFRRAIS